MSPQAGRDDTFDACDLTCTSRDCAVDDQAQAAEVAHLRKRRRMPGRSWTMRTAPQMRHRLQGSETVHAPSARRVTAVSCNCRSADSLVSANLMPSDDASVCLQGSSGHLASECSMSSRAQLPSGEPIALQVQQLEGLAEKYVAVMAQNAALHNEVQDLKGSIRVFCRVRPAGTTGDNSPPCTSASVDGEVCDVIRLARKADTVLSNCKMLPGAASDGICACWGAVCQLPLRHVCMTRMQLAIDVRGQQKLFKYDRVFGGRASQAEVYEDTKQLVRSVLDGEPRVPWCLAALPACDLRPFMLLPASGRQLT